MTRRTTSLAIASLAVGSLIMLGATSASAQDHVDVGLGFINAAGPGTGNDWATPCEIDWAAHTGKTKAACFFTLSLMKAQGYLERDIYGMWASTGPTSDKYFDLIDSSPALGSPAPEPETYFRRITTATAIARGDVIAVGATTTTPIYAGHTMVVTGPAQEIMPQVMPRYSGTKQYAVPIMDSTNTSHGCNTAYPDNRWIGDCSTGRMDPGAGTAYIRVYTDALTGILLGYTWSVTASSSSYYSPSTRPYRVGRLFKLPDPIEDPVDPPPPP